MPPTSLPILDVSKTDGVAVATFRQPEVHEMDAQRLQEELVALADGCDPADVVLDLTGVTFLTSSGIGAVIRGGQRCHQRGGNLALCNLSKSVAAVFAPFPRRAPKPGASGTAGPGSGSGGLPLFATDRADAVRQLAEVRGTEG